MGRLDESGYCPEYKKWKKELGKEKYWEDKGSSGFLKEQWARMRCGNIGRELGKGYRENKCRICEEGEENLGHVWICKEARKEINEQWVQEVEERNLTGGVEENFEKLEKILKGKINEKLCMYIYSFEKIARAKRNKEGEEESGKKTE